MSVSKFEAVTIKPDLRPVTPTSPGEIIQFPTPETDEAPYQGSFFNVMRRLIPAHDFDAWRENLVVSRAGEFGIYQWEEKNTARRVTIGDVFVERIKDDDEEDNESNNETQKAVKGGNHTLGKSREVCSYRWEDDSWRKDREGWFDEKIVNNATTPEQEIAIQNRLFEAVITHVVRDYSADIVREPKKSVQPKRKNFTKEDRRMLKKYGIMRGTSSLQETKTS